GVLPSDVPPSRRAGKRDARVLSRAQAGRAYALRRIDQGLYRIVDDPPALPPSDACAAQRAGISRDDPRRRIRDRPALDLLPIFMVEPQRSRHQGALARHRATGGPRGDTDQHRRGAALTDVVQREPGASTGFPLRPSIPRYARAQDMSKDA